MTEVQWRAIPNYEGFYEVSETGLVRSLPRVVPSPRPGQSTTRIPGRALNGSVDGTGYLAVGLHRDGRRAVRKIHRLVLEAFVGPCPEGMEACHNDGDGLNNRLENLRWDTRSGNMRDRVLHGTDPHARRDACVHGHEFTPENTRLRATGGGAGRRCVECSRKRNREWMRASRSSERQETP
jgi:hypothetical protein